MTVVLDEIEVVNPATGEVVGRVASTPVDELEAVVSRASAAFLSWREVPVSERARVFLRYQALIRENEEELAALLTAEEGKTLPDAKGDIFRGLEVVEQAANIAALLMGESVENVARGIDTHSLQQPLGVCTGVTPFNFPAMIPLWMFPLAIAAGNAFILKPSEQAPLTAQRLVELAHEAGIPKDVLQLVNGGRELVEALCDHTGIRALSFVGSPVVGKAIFARGTAAGKRVQALLGAKNHMVIMPDADSDRATSALVGAAFGASGQRCMAISVAVLVGEARAWLPDIVAKAKALKVGAGTDDGVDLGPLISAQAKARVEALIATGEREGAALELDGRGYAVQGYPHGHFVGPTIFTEVTAEMKIYQEEIFGPVLCVMCVDTLEQALALINANPFGNGTSIYTQSGAAARKFQHCVDVGQVGINVPIPVPLPFFSFSGARGSLQGDHYAYGKSAVKFYTQTKTITQRWFDQKGSSAVHTTIQLAEDQ